MKTLAELASALDDARRAQGFTYKELAARSGLTPLTVRHVLQGKAAVRATNLMALADVLGLEMVIVPKAVAASLPSAREDAVAAQRYLTQPPQTPWMVREGVAEGAQAKVFTTHLERLIGDMNARALGLSSAANTTDAPPRSGFRK